MTTQVGVEVFRDFAAMARAELLVIDETPPWPVSSARCAGTRPTTAWREGI